MAQCMYNTILLTHVQIPSTHVSAACGLAHAFNSSTGHEGQRETSLGFAAWLSPSGRHLQVSERPCLKGVRTPAILLCLMRAYGHFNLKCKTIIGSGCRLSKQDRNQHKRDVCC